MHNMAEMEKEAVGLPVVCHFLAEELCKVAAPYFFHLSIYIIQLYESILNLRIC